MKTYIERSKALEAVNYFLRVCPRNLFLRLIYQRLCDFPAADVAPVKHARWKGEGLGDYSCSLCCEVVSGNEYCYCPHCGARMDGDS